MNVSVQPNPKIQDVSDDNTDRHFQGQQKAEKIYFSCQRHQIVLLRFAAGWVILSAALILGISAVLGQGSFFQSPWMQGLFLIQAIVLVILQHLLFLKLINYHLAVVIVTNYRLIDMEKSLFMQDDKEIVDLHEIQDTKKVQSGIWPNLLNYGDIMITVASITGPMVLHDIANPEYYLNQINVAKRHYIAERRKQKGPTLTMGEAAWELPSRAQRSLLGQQSEPQRFEIHDSMAADS